LCKGAQTGIYSGVIEHLFDDLALVRPTVMLGPPRLWNFVYTEFCNQLELKTKNITGEEEKYQIERSLLAEFSKLLGGRTRYILTGGAYTSETVKEFLARCFKCPIYDGYGTSEAGGISSNGYIFENVDVKLIDVPDMGYTNQDKPYPRGEITVKTPTMTSGYFKDTENTKTSFTSDGYFRTGDIGEQDHSGRVRIIDRKKNLFKLQQGEFISPEVTHF
jgi:long-subunit acyl-CoA synthetase (AMP-forming)